MCYNLQFAYHGVMFARWGQEIRKLLFGIPLLAGIVKVICDASSISTLIVSAQTAESCSWAAIAELTTMLQGSGLEGSWFSFSSCKG